MTRRERALVIIFLVLLGALGAFWGLGTFLGRLSELDTEFSSLQGRALQLSRALLKTSAGHSSLEHLKAHFWPTGPLPSVLTLAAEVQTQLRLAGVSVLETQVTGSTETQEWVRYQAEGSIQEWFDFLLELRKADSKVLFRSLDLVRKRGTKYGISFEVGYVVFS
ncbi:MAG: hypothetical protein HKM06_02575 [Spirochaetales bacterium]|nr:hypothetical protein [Spirochaetales bacterium]